MNAKHRDTQREWSSMAGQCHVCGKVPEEAVLVGRSQIMKDFACE